MRLDDKSDYVCYNPKSSICPEFALYHFGGMPMARGRTSLKERGQEILGLKRRERAERALLKAWSRMGLRFPGSAESAPPASSAKAVAPLRFKEIDPDIERHIESMLDAEAAAAVGEDVPSAGDSGAEAPEVEKPLPAVEWISPVSPTMPRPDPAPPPVVHAKPPIEKAPSVEALPDETPVADTASAVPPSPPLPIEVDHEPQSSTPANTDKEVPATDGPPSMPLDDDQVQDLLERADVQKYLAGLEQAIRTQYERISADGVSGSKEITDWCHRLLAEARTIVIYRRLGDLPRAEWNVEQVRARLDRAEASEREWYWPVLITLWGAAWLIGLLYLVLYPAPLLESLPAANASVLPWVFLQAVLFGGVGAVAAIFYHLVRYVRDRSFAKTYVLGYFGKPFLGMILGALVYLAFFFLVRVVALVSPVEILGEAPGTVTNVLYTAPMLFVALVAGFKESLVLDTLHQFVASGWRRKRHRR
jgi:hypothetical protein